MFGFWKGLYAKILPSNGFEFANGIYYTYGSGSPEGVLSAPVGSVYINTANGAIFSKTSGSGNTGWAAGSFQGFANGTQSLPGAYFSSDTDTGWWFSDPEVVFVSGGNPLWAIDKSSGQIRAAINSIVGTDYLALYSGYYCRAWVNFNGESTVAIRASGNVSSITDVGTGQYAVNFNNAMPDTDYNAVFGGRPNSGASNDLIVCEDRDVARTTTVLTIKCRDAGANDTDPNLVSVSIFR